MGSFAGHLNGRQSQRGEWQEHKQTGRRERAQVAQKEEESKRRYRGGPWPSSHYVYVLGVEKGVCVDSNKRTLVWVCFRAGFVHQGRRVLVCVEREGKTTGPEPREREKEEILKVTQGEDERKE